MRSQKESKKISPKMMTKNKTRKMIRTRKNDQFYGLIALNIIGKRNDE